MKKGILLGILTACLSLTATARDLHQGDKIVLGMALEFNEDAKSDNAFISWALLGDWSKFDYKFSQGTVSQNVFTIKADEYKDFVNGAEGIVLTISGKSQTDAGNYNLAMKVKEISDNLEISAEDLSMEMSVNYILPPPPPLWKRLLVPAIILIVLVLIVLLVLHLTAKFPGGLLQVGHDEIYLKGKKVVSLKKELGIEFADDADVIFVKKRFDRFQGPCIKDMINCDLERDGVYLSKGAVILPDEEVVGLKDSKGNVQIIRYC